MPAWAQRSPASARTFDLVQIDQQAFGDHHRLAWDRGTSRSSAARAPASARSTLILTGDSQVSHRRAVAFFPRSEPADRPRPIAVTRELESIAGRPSRPRDSIRSRSPVRSRHAPDRQSVGARDDRPAAACLPRHRAGDGPAGARPPASPHGITEQASGLADSLARYTATSGPYRKRWILGEALIAAPWRDHFAALPTMRNDHGSVEATTSRSGFE